MPHQPGHNALSGDIPFIEGPRQDDIPLSRGIQPPVDPVNQMVQSAGQQQGQGGFLDQLLQALPLLIGVGTAGAVGGRSAIGGFGQGVAQQRQIQQQLAVEQDKLQLQQSQMRQAALEAERKRQIEAQDFLLKVIEQSRSLSGKSRADFLTEMDQVGSRLHGIRPGTIRRAARTTPTLDPDTAAETYDRVVQDHPDAPLSMQVIIDGVPWSLGEIGQAAPGRVGRDQTTGELVRLDDPASALVDLDEGDRNFAIALNAWRSRHPGETPSPSDMEAIAKEAKDLGAETQFIETTVDGQPARVAARKTEGAAFPLPPETMSPLEQRIAELTMAIDEERLQEQRAERRARDRAVRNSLDFTFEQTDKTLTQVEALLDTSGDEARLSDAAANIVGGTRVLGGLFRFVPGTPEADAKAALDTLMSRLVIDTIQAMKNASATGATGFGQLSEKEGAILQNAAARLQTAQSDEAFLEALTSIRNSLERIQRKTSEELLGLNGESGLTNPFRGQ